MVEPVVSELTRPNQPASTRRAAGLDQRIFCARIFVQPSYEYGARHWPHPSGLTKVAALGYINSALPNTSDAI